MVGLEPSLTWGQAMFFFFLSFPDDKVPNTAGSLCLVFRLVLGLTGDFIME